MTGSAPGRCHRCALLVVRSVRPVLQRGCSKLIVNISVCICNVCVWKGKRT